MRTRTEIEAEMAQVAAAGRRMNRLQNEGGEGYDHTDSARITALMAERDAVVAAEWTREVTIERRARWNAAAQVRRSNVADLERHTGIKMDELKAAVMRHSL